MLESYLRKRLEQKDILIMTHMVLGYPSFEDGFRIIEAMVEGGADMVELQIPSPKPIADGPVILKANQTAIEKGATTRKCLHFVERLTKAFDLPFLIMSYYDVIGRYGVKPFVSAMAERNLQGTIVPDLTPEEAWEFLEAMNESRLDPIFVFSPTTSDQRMRYISSLARGFIYCVARSGVTGSKTVFSEDLTRRLDRCRASTRLPLAVGFGIRDKKDIDFLRTKAEIAVIGTQLIKVMESRGIAFLTKFIRQLR